MTQRQDYDLEERLIDFAVLIIDIVELIPNTRAGNHIAGQLVRCGTLPAPNYGDAQSAESRKDFVHKLKIVLKEPRESRVWLLMLLRKGLIDRPEMLQSAVSECDQLLRIFRKSAQTAESGL